ncbi:MAG: homoserine dehydrogenase [Acidobacteriota bacterium]|nr:homoserine dehydrogenase [Acidobacteriota bacterium]
MRRLSVLLVGRGNVGGTFARQLTEALDRLEREGFEVRLCGVAARGALAIQPQGFGQETWQEGFEPCSGSSVRKALKALEGVRPLVLVDATADPEMSANYRHALDQGVHIVSCNKIPFSGPQSDFDALFDAARGHGLYVRHESTVGAGLPTLGTLRNLRQSGDTIEQISGCFSGTLNLLCAGLDTGKSFSSLLASATKNGFTEPDPREDLSGRDVARKVLILARLAGDSLEPGDVRCLPMVETDNSLPVDGFMTSLEPYDRVLGERSRRAARGGKVLRYIARAAPAEAGCELAEVSKDNPLARLTGPENVFVFTTRRYTVPLVINGPGAGPEVTAGGLFADLLEVGHGVADGVAREKQA